MIKKVDGKYFVYSESGKKLGGPYASKGQATKRLQQIEFFKHKQKLVWEVQDFKISEAEGKKGVLKLSGVALETGKSRNKVSYRINNIDENDGKMFNFLVGHRADYDNPDHNVGEGVYHKLNNQLKFSGEIENSASHPDIVESVRKGRVSVSVQGGYKSISKKDNEIVVEGLRVPLLCLVNKHARGVDGASIESAIEEKIQMNNEGDNIIKELEGLNMTEEYAVDKLREVEGELKKLKEQNEELEKTKGEAEKKVEDLEKEKKESEEKAKEEKEKAEEKAKLDIIDKLMEKNKEFDRTKLMEKSVDALQIAMEYEYKLSKVKSSGASEVVETEDKDDALKGIIIEKNRHNGPGDITMSEAMRKEFNKEMMKSIYR
jgi:hypothetical protein